MFDVFGPKQWYAIFFLYSISESEAETNSPDENARLSKAAGQDRAAT